MNAGIFNVSVQKGAYHGKEASSHTYPLIRTQRLTSVLSVLHVLKQRPTCDAAIGKIKQKPKNGAKARVEKVPVELYCVRLILVAPSPPLPIPGNDEQQGQLK
jgi:hypothetical protein